MTQLAGVDGAACAVDAAKELEALSADLPAPPLRVFISYKEKDQAATVDIKKLLLRIGGANIRVFVSGEELEANPWRDRILKELREAHLLMFLYTDPEARWDWCLYETGYFDARQNPADLDRRLYVLHGRDVPPSGPFLGLNTVAVDTSDKPDDTKLKGFLKVLFELSTKPSVNPHWNEGGCADLVTALAAPFRRRQAVAPPEEYIRRLTFRLPKGTATEAALRAGRIPSDAMVSGNVKSFDLFGFGSANARTWQALENAWRRKVPAAATGSTIPDSVTLWIESAAQKMQLAIDGDRFDDGLPLFFSQFAETGAQALFRPSLARLVQYTDAYEFDIVFVDVPTELASPSEGPLSTVGSLLRLAHMFRFGWIEATAKDIVNRPRSEIAEIAKDMRRRMNSITAESFNQGIRTEQAVWLAFEEGSALQAEVKQSMEAWRDTVAPAIVKSFNGQDTDAMLDALKMASAVNWKFHRACAQRYRDIVDHHCQANTGPIDRV